MVDTVLGSPLHLGHIEVRAIKDGSYLVPEPPGVAELPAERLAAHRGYIPGDGTYLVEVGAFLIEVGERRILVDAGIGPSEAPDQTFHCAAASDAAKRAYADLFRSYGRSEQYVEARLAVLEGSTVSHGRLEENLNAAGVAPAEVTDVVLTHLHPDHVGWLTRNGESFFPTAAIWAHQADVDHFLGADAASELHYEAMFGVAPTKVRLAPARDQLRIWDGPACQIAPGVALRHVPGHTPGSSIVALSGGGRTALLLGDVVHCPLEMTEPDWSLRADHDHAQAQASRRALIDEHVDESTLLGSPHFEGLRFGRLEAGPDGYAWVWTE